MNEQQFLRLEKYDKILTAAAKKKFFRYPDAKSKTEITEVYSEITGRKVGSGSCGSCSGISWMQRLGKWYTEYKSKFKSE